MSLPFRRPRRLAIVATGLLAPLPLAGVFAAPGTSARPAPAAPGTATGATLRPSSHDQVREMMFVSLPGIGSAVMSLGSDGQPVFAPAALHRDQLTFLRDGHQRDLSGIVLPQGADGAHATHFLIHLDCEGSRAPLTPVAQPATTPKATL